jgi:predicted nucleic acid-binding protein
MLTDTGPLVALIDQKQPPHKACREVYEAAESPLLTTWPCFSEAMHILGRIGGWPPQALLWGLLRHSGLHVHAPSSAEIERMHILMGKYKDRPMDLADASLVAAAEARQVNRIFTLDSDFRFYRLNDKDSFEVIP